MAPRADLTVFDRRGRPVAIAEVKSKTGTSRDWATAFRRNLASYSEFFEVDFFLLVTPDRLYVWKGTTASPDLVEPSYEVDATQLLKPYFARTGLDPQDISGYAFELMVGSWLADLTRYDELPKELATEQSWLLQSGFLAAVKDGRVEYEVAA